VFKTVLHFGLSRQKNNFVSKDADSILPAVSSICRNEPACRQAGIILFDSIRPRFRTDVLPTPTPALAQLTIR